MTDLLAPTPLTSQHNLSHFNNGYYPELDLWLIKHALSSQQSGSARSFVACKKRQVVAYYSLTLKSLKSMDSLPPKHRISRGMPAYEIPCILLARLAVDKHHQNLGLGRSLMIDALQRVLAVAQEVGTRALLVDAIDESAAHFYQHFGFELVEQNSLTLYMLVKDIRKTITG